jgi:geranylgeranyl diphosphate synthase type I
MKNLEEPIVKVQKMLKKDGAKGWNMAKEILLKHETDNPQLKQALAYLTLIPDYFRPAIVSYCCEAVGGEPEITVPTGASLVLLAKAIGIHDDLIDKTKKRDGHVTTFGKFGKDVALVLSDVLLFKGFTLLRKNLEIGISSFTMVKILETIDHVWFEQCEGAVSEFESRRNLDLTPEKYLAIIRKKASELEATTRIGGILGHGSQSEINILGKIGRILGMISLLRDEIIDMLEFNVLKHRIMHESLPLPVIYAGQKADVRSEIISLISKRKPTIKDMQKLSKIVDKAGGIEQTAYEILRKANQAKKYLKLIKKESSKFKILIESHVLYPKDWKAVLESI